MKKLFMTMLTVLACGAAYALPVGNPSEASLLIDGLFWEGNCGDICDPCASWCDAFSFRVGFYGDYVFNRHLEVHDGDDGILFGDSQLEHAEIYTNAAYLALNFWDRFDIFATLGSTSFRIESNSTSFGLLSLGSRLEIDTYSWFSWSVGGRLTLWECGCTALGIEGQYFSTRPHVMRATFASVVSDYPDDDDARGHYTEWQVGLGLSHRINILVPYIAVKYSRAHLDFDDYITSFGALLPDIRSSKHWGYAVGVSLVDCEKALVTVEGRFGDERALYVNGQIRF